MGVQHAQVGHIRGLQQLIGPLGATLMIRSHLGFGHVVDEALGHWERAELVLGWNKEPKCWRDVHRPNING